MMVLRADYIGHRRAQVTMLFVLWCAMDSYREMMVNLAGVRNAASEELLAQIHSLMVTLLDQFCETWPPQ